MLESFWRAVAQFFFAMHFLRMPEINGKGLTISNRGFFGNSSTTRTHNRSQKRVTCVVNRPGNYAIN